MTTKKIDFDEIAKKRKELELRSSGGILDVKIGWNYMYFLPPYDDEGHFYVEVWRHSLLVCPLKTNGSSCVICDELSKKSRKNDKEFQKYSLQPRAFFNVILRQDLAEGITQIFSPSAKSFREILEYIDENKCNPMDPIQSLLFGIKKSVVNGKTIYKTNFGQPTDISKYLTNDVLSRISYLPRHPFLSPASKMDMINDMARRGYAYNMPDNFDDVPPVDDSNFKESDKKIVDPVIEEDPEVEQKQIVDPVIEEDPEVESEPIDPHELTAEEKAYVEAKIREMRSKNK